MERDINKSFLSFQETAENLTGVDLPRVRLTGLSCFYKALGKILKSPVSAIKPDFLVTHPRAL